jgi:hypothetical protein
VKRRSSVHRQAWSPAFAIHWETYIQIQKRKNLPKYVIERDIPGIENATPEEAFRLGHIVKKQRRAVMKRLTAKRSRGRTNTDGMVECNFAEGLLGLSR